jgi:hypothetical protein
VLTVAAVAVVGVALVARREWIAVFGAGVLATAYALALFIRGSQLDGRVPLFAALLVIVPELTAWSTQSVTRVETEPRVALLRLGAVAAVAGAAVAAAGVVIGVAGVDVAGGLAWEAAGVAAAVGVFGLLAALARRA